MTGVSAALREAADLLDAHRDLPKAYVSTGSFGATIHWFIESATDDAATQKATAAQIIRAVGGTWDKTPSDSGTFYFRQKRDPLRFVITVTRDAVCERVVTGTREVTYTVPAQDAVPAQTFTEVVEDVEWVCAPLLADAPAAPTVAFETSVCEVDDCDQPSTDIAWPTGRSVCDDHGDQPHVPEPVTAGERDL